MRVVTIATDLDNWFLSHMLVPSCVSLGLELSIIRPRRAWGSFSDKRPAMMRLLADLDPNEIIVFTDGYDGMFVRGPDKIAAAHAALGGRIVFSAEPNCWPLGVLGFALYGERAPGRYAYLNSGGFIARAGELAEVYARFPVAPSKRFELLRDLQTHGFDPYKQFGWSDQYYWTLVHLAEPQTVALDRDAALFECFTPSIPVVAVSDVKREMEIVRELGRSAPQYIAAKPAIVEALSQPSTAAHIHFASVISKLVFEELAEEGALPAWIANVVAAATDVDRSGVRVHDV